MKMFYNEDRSMVSYECYRCKLRNGQRKTFKDMTDDEVLDTLDLYQSRMKELLPKTTKAITEYAADRNLIKIIDEVDL